jgi:hypothetical protein
MQEEMNRRRRVIYLVVNLGSTISFFLFLLAGCTPVGRDVTMVSAVWRPSKEPLSLVDDLDLLTDAEEAMLLSDMSLAGEIDVFRYFSTGQGTGSRIVLILQKPVEEPIRLAIPRDGSVIYIQEATGWKSIPGSVATLDDLYILVETIQEGQLVTTEAKLVLPRGGTELMGGVGWTPEP